MSVQQYDISNLNCAACASKIESKIQSLPEVHDAKLDLLNQRLVVRYKEEPDNHLGILNRIADMIEPGARFSLSESTEPAVNPLRKWMPLIAGTVLLFAGAVLFPSIHAWLGIAGYLLVGHRVLLAAVKSLLSRHVFSEHLLMSLATVGAIILGEYTEAGAVMILYEIGQELESRALDHSRRAVRRSLEQRPASAHLETPEGLEDRPLSMIQAADLIHIFPGERVPLDGIVEQGESTIDTSSLTGESEPRTVGPRGALYAGYLNLSGLLRLRVTNTETESAQSRILAMIEEAGSRKSPREKFISRFAAVYTPLVVSLSLLVFLIPTLFGADPAIWFKRALVFLIVSCPCALVISIPLSYFIGIGLAAKRGVILKGSVFLDAMRQVRTIVFDKTGTLTTGDLQIEKVIATDGTLPTELLETLYRCEYTSNHPYAKAVKSSLSADYDSKLVNAYSEYPGRGVLLLYGNERLIAGSAGFMREHGFVDLIDTQGQSAVHAARDDRYLGCVTFGDELKSDLKPALESLRGLGIERMLMLSGDRVNKAAQVSAELALDGYYAELLPEQKLGILEEIISESPHGVAFVGDGMNDAPSLARADVGIAMGGIGNDASVETADVVLLNDKPGQLTELLRVSRQTGRVVAQNIALALGIKVLVMALGVGGVSGLWEAIIADVGVTLLVIFNSLRMLRAQRGT